MALDAHLEENGSEEEANSSEVEPNGGIEVIPPANERASGSPQDLSEKNGQEVQNSLENVMLTPIEGVVPDDNEESTMVEEFDDEQSDEQGTADIGEIKENENDASSSSSSASVRFYSTEIITSKTCI